MPVRAGCRGRTGGIGSCLLWVLTRFRRLPSEDFYRAPGRAYSAVLPLRWTGGVRPGREALRAAARLEKRRLPCTPSAVPFDLRPETSVKR
jgi:hypothetical protein